MSIVKIVKVDPQNPEQGPIKEAADILKNGGLVIIPTETVYGIAANMLNKKTLDRLYDIKGRPANKPFSLHIAEENEIEKFSINIPSAAYRLIDKFWPGPLTLILKAKDKGTIGIRMPDNLIANSVIKLSGVPVVCPSANLSGEPAPVSFQEAVKDLGGKVDFAIDAGEVSLKLESSVVDLTVNPPCVLREAAIKKEEILAVAAKKTILFVCTGNSCRSVMAEALLKKILQKKKRQDVEVLSAGIIALNAGATEATKQALAKEGIDVSRHVCRQITPSLIKKSDLILVMEHIHEQRILEMVPTTKDKLFLLKEFAKIEDNELDLADPIGRSLEFYTQTLASIKEAVERVSEII